MCLEHLIGEVPRGHPNQSHHNWLLSIWRSSGHTMRPSWMTNLLPLSLRENPGTLLRTFISATFLHLLFLSWLPRVCDCRCIHIYIYSIKRERERQREYFLNNLIIWALLCKMLCNSCSGCRCWPCSFLAVKLMCSGLLRTWSLSLRWALEPPEPFFTVDRFDTTKIWV